MWAWGPGIARRRLVHRGDSLGLNSWAVGAPQRRRRELALARGGKASLWVPGFPLFGLPLIHLKTVAVAFFFPDVDVLGVPGCTLALRTCI